MNPKHLRSTAIALFVGSLLAPPAEAFPLSAFNDSQVVVDGGPEKREMTVGAGIVTGVSVQLEFMKCDDPLVAPLPSKATGCEGLGSAYAREIIFRLISPQGTEISLIEADTYFPSGSDPTPGGRITVIFDNGASNLVGASGFVTETAHPVELFNPLFGENAAGVWTLYMKDDAGGDPLGFVRVDLTINADPARVPEPGTLALLGLGLFGLGVLRRRRA